MVRSRQKNGVGANRGSGVSPTTPLGAKTVSVAIAPPLLTGGERKVAGNASIGESGNQTVREGRERLNLSVGPQVKLAVENLSSLLGMTESQLVAHALLMAMPALLNQAETVTKMRGGFNG